jgi:ATP-dependent Clp protease ATP-binding subunit ClpA
MLTEKVRRKPYSIVLFDEIEKGNFDIYNLLLQILEDGSITDGKGRVVNFKNTIIIMTSNIGSEEFNSQAEQIGFAVSDREEAKIIRDYEVTKEKILKQLSDFFAPEFLNRIDKTVVFSPLDKTIMKKIVGLQLDEFVYRLAHLSSVISGKNLTLSYDTKAVNAILEATYNPEF